MGAELCLQPARIVGAPYVDANKGERQRRGGLKASQVRLRLRRREWFLIKGRVSRDE